MPRFAGIDGCPALDPARTVREQERNLAPRGTEPRGAGRLQRYWICIVTGRATAPGPGRSPAESTSELKVSGMQKMLTRLPGCGRPPVVSAPAVVPVSTMVRATSTAVKAPEVRWPQLLKAPRVEQSVFDVHGTGRHGSPPHATQGVPMEHEQATPEAEPLHRRANVLRVLLRQKPQNTAA